MKRIVTILAVIWFAAQALWALQSSHFSTAGEMVLSPSALQNSGVDVSSSLWQYHPGDDLEWANPAFDARSWVVVRPDFDASQLYQIAWNGSGWFRLSFRRERAGLDEVFFHLYHYGASEIYVDGKLIRRFGVPDNVKEREQTMQASGYPLVLHLHDTTLHTLAIRYSHSRALSLAKSYGEQRVGLCGFRLAAYSAAAYKTNVIDEQQNTAILTSIPLGILGILFILHTLLFVFYPKDYSNLFFALLAMTLFVNAMAMLLPAGNISHTALIWSKIIFGLSSSISGLFLMMSVYSLLYARLPQRFYSLVIPIIIIGLINSIWNPPWKAIISFMVVVLLAIEIIHTLMLTFRKKQRGTYILIIGSLLFLGTSLLYWIMHFLQISLNQSIVALFALGDLAMPITMTLLTARRYSHTNQYLMARLSDVQELSVRTLEQEREKQAMIARQNEELEQQVQQRTTELRGKNIELVEANIEIQRQVEVQRTQAEKIRLANDELQKKNSQIEEAMYKLQSMQSHLVQAEKMAGLGQLTAGIAHEINNPLNFIVGSLSPLRRNMTHLISMLDLYDAVFSTVTVSDELQRHITTVKQHIEYDALVPEVRSMMQSMDNGAHRILEIVRGLRVFSRVDEDMLKTADIHEGINSTLTILHSQYKDFITITREYGDIPEIECYPGQLNQVFMNLIANAIEAITETQTNGEIRIKTLHVGDNVEITFSDTGVGINPEAIHRVFEPFFTTKDVGKGTGLGLSIAFGIVEKHRGTIHVQSLPGTGTSFIITLPVIQHAAAEKEHKRSG